MPTAGWRRRSEETIPAPVEVEKNIRIAAGGNKHDHDSYLKCSD